jgi:hypothetical protein
MVDRDTLRRASDIRWRAASCQKTPSAENWGGACAVCGGEGGEREEKEKRRKEKEKKGKGEGRKEEFPYSSASCLGNAHLENDRIINEFLETN